MQPAQPAVAPGGGAAGDQSGIPIFSRTPQRPNNVNLTPQEQQALIASLGSGVPPGSFIVGGTAVSQPKMGTAPGGASVQMDVGEYQVTVQTPDGRTVPMTVTRSTDPGGNPSWIAQPPKDMTPTTKATSPTDYVVKTTDNGTWYPDDVNNPGGGYHQILPPGIKNEDEEITKAVARQVAEGERNARQANFAKYGFYGTDTEYANFQHQAAADKLSAAELKQRQDEFNQTHKYDDENQAIKDRAAADALKTSAVGREATTAGTAQTKATTAQTAQTTEQQAQRFPGELKQQAATLAATEASTASTKQATQIAGAPQPTVTSTDPYITSKNPLTGDVTQSQQNLNYQATTQPQIAARVGQLQALMNQKGAEVQGKVGQTIDGKIYTADDALRDFNAWHDANIAPQQASLQAAQENVQFARAKDEAEMRRQAYQQALGAGTQNINAINARTSMNPVGDSYASVMDQVRQGKMPSGADMAGAFTYQAEDPTVSAQKATMEALKYIDPRVAAANGMPPPNPQGIDIAGMLNRTNYLGPPGAPAATGAPAPGTVAAPASQPIGEAPDDWYAKWQARQANDVLLQRQQAQAQAAAAGQPNPYSLIKPQTTNMPNFGSPVMPWDLAPNYVPGG